MATTTYVERTEQVIENASFAGDQVALRDINIYQGKPHFHDIDPALFPDDYPAPVFTEQVYQKLQSSKIIVLTGNHTFDKSNFARFVAGRLAVENNLQVREFIRTEEDGNYLRDLSVSNGPTIFLISNVHPRNFDYDLQKLHTFANSKDCYIILSTNISKASWELNPIEEKNFWFEIPESNLYSRQTIERELKKKLESRALEIPEVDHPKELESYFLPFTVGELAQRFRTPEEIDLFIHFLIEEDEKPSASKVDVLLKEITEGNDTLVSKWYRRLDMGNQLIALGVALLEGMYDDQFFSVLQRVVLSSWVYREPRLNSLDYCDLEFLSNFFLFEEIRVQKRLLTGKYDRQRTEVIRAAWNSHRRHILTALPTLTEIAIQTISRKHVDWEIFGSRDRRMALRNSIGKVISDIGSVSVHSVEGSLLKFASCNEITLQRITAKALARWRELEKDGQLFELLERWLRDDHVQDLIEEFLRNRQEEDSSFKIKKKANVYIKACVLLTLGYAANYDSPNHLDSRIIELFRSLASESDPLIMNRIADAFPRLIHHHSLQLKEVLMNQFMSFEHLIDPIGEGLALAYGDYPKDLTRTIHSWIEATVGNSSKDNRRKKLTNRDRIVKTILRFFSKINFGKESIQFPISIKEVLEFLCQLNKHEKRENLRLEVFHTASRILTLSPMEAFPYLPRLTKGIRWKEAEILVSGLSKAYTEERRELQGSEYLVNINDEFFDSWGVHHNRPVTKLETILMTWITSGQSSAETLAIYSFLEISKTFEYLEWVSDKISKNPLPRTADLDAESLNSANGQQQNSMVKRRRRPSLILRIYLFFLLLFERKERKAQLKRLIHQLIKVNGYNSDHLRIVLFKWSKGTNPLTTRLSRIARKTMFSRLLRFFNIKFHRFSDRSIQEPSNQNK